MKSRSIILTVLAALLISAAFLPLFFSKNFGRRLLVQHVLNSRILEKKGYSLDVNSLRLSWFGPQTAVQIKLHGTNHDKKIEADKIVANVSLLRLPFASLFSIPITIDNFKLEDPKEQLRIKNTQLRTTQREIVLSGQSEISGNKTPFSLSIISDKPIRNIKDLIEAQIEGKNLPVELADALTESDHLFTKALGPFLNVTLRKSDRSFFFNVSSKELKSRISLQNSGKELQTLGENFTRWTWSPAFCVELNKRLGFLDAFPTEGGAVELRVQDFKQQSLEAGIKPKFSTGLINKMLGADAAINVRLGKKDKAITASLSFSSSTIQSEPLQFELGTGISLLNPAMIKLRIDKTSYTEQKIALDLLLKSFNFSLGNSVQVQADLASLEPLLIRTKSTGLWMVLNLFAAIEGNTAQAVNIDAQAKIKGAESPFPFNKIASIEMNLDCKTKLRFENNRYSDADYILTIAHPQGNANFNGKLNVETLFGSGKVSYSLDPVEWNRLGLQKNVPFPSGLTYGSLKIKYFEVPLKKPFYNHFKFDGQLEIDALDVNDQQEARLASINLVRSPIFIDGPGNKITASINAQTYDALNKKPGSAESHITLLRWHDSDALNFKKMIVRAQSDVRFFPTAFLEMVSGKEGLHELLGKHLDFRAEADIDFQKASAGDLTLRLAGDKFDFSGGFVINEQSITLKEEDKPAAATWTMTPRRFTVFRKLLADRKKRQVDSILLDNTTKLKLNIWQLSIPWLIPSGDKGKQLTLNNFFGLPHMALSMQLSANNLSLKDTRTKRGTKIDDAQIQLETKDLLRSISIAASSNGGATYGKTFFDLKANAKNIFTEAGRFDIKQFSGTLNSLAKNVPIGLFCDAALLSDQMVDQMDALIGERLDSSIKLHLQEGQGDIQADLQGTNGTAAIDGKIENGYLTLNSPLVASLQVTPKLSKSVLQPLIPLLSTAYKADNPITIIIQPEGFLFPFFAWDPKKIQISLGILDMGRLYFHYGRQLEQILNVLNASVDKDIGVPIWFTPLYFSLKNGIADCKRIDMLTAGKYHIALWGNVDFPGDRVKMTLGISGTALKNAFGIKGISDESFLQLALRGSTNDAKIDKSKTAARVASLIAQSGKGTEGLVISGIVDILTGTLGETQPPKPTTFPFPWSNDEQQSSEPDSEKQKKNGTEQILEKGKKEIFKFFKKIK